MDVLITEAADTAQRTRRPPSPTADLRAILETTGDVRLGGRGRRDRHRRFGLSLLGFVLLCGAGVLYLAATPSDARATPRDYVVGVHCDACGVTREQAVTPSEPPPWTCQSCGAKAGHEVWRCRICNQTFEPDPAQHFFSCPRCRSTAVGSAVEPPTP